MIAFIRRLLAIALFSLLFIGSQAQPTETAVKKEPRPYKFSSSGNQITLRCNKNIQNVMLWTTNGHRVVEQRDINTSSYTFTVPVNDKVFFLMVGLEGGKIFTEKIGIR